MIESGVVDPLTGFVDAETQASGLTISNTITRAYGSNLFFEPVPLEFLQAPDTLPQVMVTVAGIEALCPAMNCGYNIEENAGIITAQSNAASGSVPTNDYEITGTDIPTPTRVSVDDIDCVTSAVSATSITCTTA